jgi:hypothetical protein
MIGDKTSMEEHQEKKKLKKKDHRYFQGAETRNYMFRNAENAGKKLVRHQNFFWSSTSSVWHRHSGIRVTPVPLVTD